jgi:hypothetical protein
MDIIGGLKVAINQPFFLEIIILVCLQFGVAEMICVLRV